MLTILRIYRDRRQWYVHGQVEVELNDAVYQQISTEVDMQSYSKVDTTISSTIWELAQQITFALEDKWGM